MHSGARSRGAGTAAGAAGMAGVGGLAGGSVVGSAESLMSAAFLMASGAGILPPALMVAFQFKLATGKPQNLEAAAQSWSTAAEQCQKAAHDLRELVDGIPEQAWKMDDRAAYENKVADYCLQLDALHNYCMAVSYALTVLAYALFTYALFAIGVATYLDVLAVAALAIVDYPECVALAGTALTVTWVATGILATAGGIAAATMGGGASFTADYQVDHGNADADDAFKRALATGSAGAAANLAQNAANAGLAYLNRSNGNIERLPGTAHATSGSRGFPLQEIDLDADRGINKTWNVGGGAKAQFPAGAGPEFEFGSHHKIGSKGYEGGDFEFKGKKPAGPVDLGLGGKVERDGEGNVNGGGFNVGAEQPETGSKAGYEGGWDDKGKYTDKLQGTTPAGSREWNPVEKKKDDTPPWDK
ncbi:hypothetical protein [Actinomadura yumaensis]|uniref:Uncharacterized protein n=2 Tax=Actinomadura TaxID=1988 RepID=A0ABW2CHE5_9ACTN